MLASHCGDLVLDKTRHYVPHAGLVWHVDVYEGSLDGVVLAEVELPDENTGLALAEWVGAEVTGRPEYKKINLHRMGQAALARRRAG
jgi:CYTH domain-containing protein